MRIKTNLKAGARAAVSPGNIGLELLNLLVAGFASQRSELAPIL